MMRVSASASKGLICVGVGGEPQKPLTERRMHPTPHPPEDTVIGACFWVLYVSS